MGKGSMNNEKPIILTHYAKKVKRNNTMEYIKKYPFIIQIYDRDKITIFNTHDLNRFSKNDNYLSGKMIWSSYYFVGDYGLSNDSLDWVSWNYSPRSNRTEAEWYLYSSETDLLLDTFTILIKGK